MIPPSTQSQVLLGGTQNIEAISSEEFVCSSEKLFPQSDFQNISGIIMDLKFSLGIPKLRIKKTHCSITLGFALYLNLLGPP